MSILRKVVSRLASPLDRYVMRRVQKKEIVSAAESIILSRVERMIQKTAPMPSSMLSFAVHLAEHCNLNCKGCDNFCPVAKEGLLSADEYENDCKRLSELFNGKVGGVILSGGEPLLNPDIVRSSV